MSNKDKTRACEYLHYCRALHLKCDKCTNYDRLINRLGRLLKHNLPLPKKFFKGEINKPRKTKEFFCEVVNIKMNSVCETKSCLFWSWLPNYGNCILHSCYEKNREELTVEEIAILKDRSVTAVQAQLTLDCEAFKEAYMSTKYRLYQ